MKSLQESIQLNEGVLRGRLSSDDKRNYQIIADALSNIVAEVSSWAEQDDDFENSDTAAFAHELDHLAGLLRNDWDSDVTFSPKDFK